MIFTTCYVCISRGHESIYLPSEICRDTKSFEGIISVYILTHVYIHTVSLHYIPSLSVYFRHKTHKYCTIYTIIYRTHLLYFRLVNICSHIST